MAQVRDDRSQQKRSPREEMLEREVEELKTQLMGMYAEKQALESANQNYAEKVNDLKYNNAELKSLNDRTTQLHLKEIEMLKKEAAQADLPAQVQERERRLLREKEGLEKKLESCAEIAKEMEDYYVGEIRKLKEALKQREEEVRNLNKELEGTRTQRASQGESLKQCNERWEKACGEMREEY